MAACGAGDDADTAMPDEEPSGASIEGEWIADSLTVDGERIELDDDSVTLTIEGDDVSGTAACNSYFGTLDAGGGASGGFVVTELSWTEMGCEPDVMELEQTFLGLLETVDAFELTDHLHLAEAGTGNGIRLTRADAPADASFTDTTWVLDTAIDGDAASSAPGMEEVHIRFVAGGGIVGATGCHGIVGEWTADGSSLTVGQASETEIPESSDCAPPAEAVDGLVFDMLRSPDLTFEVDGRRLTITDRDGNGLGFRVDRQ